MVALADLAGLDAAHVATEIVGFVAVVARHQLHRKAQRIVVRFIVDRERLEHLDQGRTGVPRHAVGGGHDIVACQCGQGNRPDVLQAELLRKRGIGGHDAVIDTLVVVHQVHLVDGHDHMLDLQQVRDRRMALGLDQQLDAAVVAELHFRDVDQDDHRIGGRCAGHHVAGVLLMSRRVGDDELALRRGEVAVGDVDGDALLALGF